ncbi:hypothetical protein TNCT_121791 [Trichonephila clavata]|uniref:Uncharacterized protein n=1 Tax=Trichonephila clavata TaxID=2740835 RepID=A0A8X6F5V8_TRICU|nr:hypothetical protein TNCT_121791 [Trichonephila clavata]
MSQWGEEATLLSNRWTTPGVCLGNFLEEGDKEKEWNIGWTNYFGCFDEVRESDCVEGESDGLGSNVRCKIGLEHVENKQMTAESQEEHLIRAVISFWWGVGAASRR